MKINSTTTIIGDKVILVPYLTHHVEKYHQWMSNPELQELTASEPLTLQAEYDMQQSWLNDEDKCTFIVLDKLKYEKEKDEVSAMIGDTNLFISDRNEPSTGEIEVMIAEKDARGGGRGRETTQLMLRYCLEKLSITKFLVKIGCSNEPSTKLFESLKFVEVSRSEVFNQVTLEAQVTEDWKKSVIDATHSYCFHTYRHNYRY